ncbi:nucleoside-diphosphate kinase [Thermohalobacter berrensis]|uniref:Nucleoside diphosphate kinase n=1 Tax=Thermohalobacter berrensis TaxID=99594 RepID=A0A419SZH6_9FIRM|nr:nucleoside-diphosphate kinase [Thermohalobacter berrensis]RKD30568.1 nucleoside-diphosphate kinase [Thermohalobacter berrensis]
MEETLVIIKPDGVKRGLVGEIINRYERKGLKIKNCKLINADRETLRKHYVEHEGKDYFRKLIQYMQEGPIIVMVLEGNEAIKLVRNINGNKDFTKAIPGTIRGDFASSITKNIVHGSDSVESAKREINVWFN